MKWIRWIEIGMFPAQMSFYVAVLLLLLKRWDYTMPVSLYINDFDWSL